MDSTRQFDDVDATLRAKMAVLPPLAGYGAVQWRIEPLGGLTNRNFKLTCAGESYVLRLAGAGTGRYIDRAAEAVNARIAAAIGLGPEVLFFDSSDGTMVTRFIEGAANLDGEQLRKSAMLEAASRALARLHQTAEPFRGRMRLFPKLDAYLSLADQAETGFGSALRAARAEAGPLRRALEARPEALSPCHIDPAPHNFLAADRVYLIDWEYAAMGEPMWDLAYLSIEAGFDPAQDAAMLEIHYGTVSAALTSRLVLFKAGLDLLSAAWSAVQIASGNTSTDFASFAAERLQRFYAVLGDAAYGRHLARVGA